MTNPASSSGPQPGVKSGQNLGRRLASIPPAAWQRVLPTARNTLVGLALVGVFIFLLLKAQSIDFNRHNRYVIELRRVQEIDARLNQNILQARDGLLTYYDPLVAAVAELKQLQKQLEQPPAFISTKGRGELVHLLQTYKGLFHKKEMLIEQFKSRNAVLHNSLAYFPIAVTQLTEPQTTQGNGYGYGYRSQSSPSPLAPELVTQLNRLLRTLLIYTLSPSEDLQPSIEAQIAYLTQFQTPKSVQGDSVDLAIVLNHGQTILKTKPKVQQLVQQLLALPTDRRSEALFQTYDRYYIQVLQTTGVYRFWLYIFSIVLVLGIASSIIITLRRSAVALYQEQQRSERLLLNILPASIAARLKQNHHSIADSFAEVTVLFADIVDFTKLAENMAPTALVSLLNEIFSTFDRLVEKHGLEKIKTIGDAYMAVGGLPMPQVDHTEAIAEMALDMRTEIEQFNQAHQSHYQIRIGIHTGPVVAGVIGIKKFTYDLWGDTVNMASRMESQGIPGSIQVSEVTYERLKAGYQLEDRGTILIKGKGEQRTYFLNDRK